MDVETGDRVQIDKPTGPRISAEVVSITSNAIIIQDEAGRTHTIGYEMVKQGAMYWDWMEETWVLQ